jgi:hypothetical protein
MLLIALHNAGVVWCRIRKMSDEECMVDIDPGKT